MSVLAIDIDLGRITAVHSELGAICHGVEPFFGAPMLGKAASEADTILVEIAGPIMHHEESHSHRRWMIYNAVVAAKIVSAFDRYAPVLVATSTAWTKGYSEIERDAIAGIHPLKYKTVTRTKAGKSKVTREPIWAEPHDCREARCMIYFFLRDPKPWVPLDQYLKALCAK